MNTSNKYTASTDGSCNNNSTERVGGSSYVILQSGNIIKSAACSFTGTTNNRMELLAIVSVVNWLPERSEVVIHSDSQYSINALSGRVTPKTKNPDLIIKFKKIVLEKHIKVDFSWVKGHNGDRMNGYADYLAYKAFCMKCNELGIPVNEVNSSEHKYYENSIQFQSETI